MAEEIQLWSPEQDLSPDMWSINCTFLAQVFNYINSLWFLTNVRSPSTRAGSHDNSNPSSCTLTDVGSQFDVAPHSAVCGLADPKNSAYLQQINVLC